MCKYLKSVVMCSLTDLGRKNIAVKPVFPSQFVLEQEDKSLNSEKPFLLCQRMEMIDGKMKGERRVFQGDSRGEV